jgi:signal transduction histidine kinase
MTKMPAKISSASTAQNGDVRNTSRKREWRILFFAARTRILAWYVMLMAFCTLVTILAIRQSLLSSLEQRVEKSLEQEVKEFRALVEEGRNPETGQPFGEDVKSLFKVFLSRNIPEDDEFLITLRDGKVYKSSPRALPDSISRNPDLVNYWAKLTRAEQSKKETSVHTIFYIAEPVKIGGKTLGVFVSANTMAGEREEIDEAVAVVTKVSLTVLVVASVLAWLAAGPVLAPLRELTETARSITESDLTQRITVQGEDEIAELTITFNEMLDRLEAAFSSQRNFINDASHELRTPITIIRGHLELLGDEPQERRETIELVLDELDRMSRFVNDLLLLAKAEQPDFLTLETVEISSLTEELYVKARGLAQRDWRLEGKGSGILRVDRQRLTQAVLNLAHNATQHTSAGDVIALGSTLKDGKALFWVRDTGVGIPLADQSRIFERFARGVGRRRSEGSGLGLSIVRAIAQSHGGSVELSSQPGSGSTFTLVIPVNSPQRFVR